MEDVRTIAKEMSFDEIDEILEEISLDEAYKGKKAICTPKKPKLDYDFIAAVDHLKSIQDDEHFLLLSMDNHNMHYYEDEFWWSESMLEAIESGADTGWYFCEEYAKRFVRKQTVKVK